MTTHAQQLGAHAHGESTVTAEELAVGQGARQEGQAAREEAEHAAREEAARVEQAEALAGEQAAREVKEQAAGEEAEALTREAQAEVRLRTAKQAKRRRQKASKARKKAAEVQYVQAVERYGDGDHLEAARQYGLAAAQGDADAQCRLGSCFEFGEGVAPDVKEAARLYRLAAAQGHPMASMLLQDMGHMLPDSPRHPAGSLVEVHGLVLGAPQVGAPQVSA